MSTSLNGLNGTSRLIRSIRFQNPLSASLAGPVVDFANSIIVGQQADSQIIAWNVRMADPFLAEPEIDLPQRMEIVDRMRSLLNGKELGDSLSDSDAVVKAPEIDHSPRRPGTQVMSDKE